MLPQNVRNRLASELNIAPDTVAALEERLDAGDPIPYVARRFPDRVHGLDIAGLRRAKHRIEEARDLELRRANVLKSLEDLGEAGERLRSLAHGAVDRAFLEDIAAHQRKHRGTRGTEAVAKGLEPLADALAAPTPEPKTPEEVAGPFVSEEKGVATAQDALHGAMAILAERYAAEPEVRARVRREMRDKGEIVSKIFDANKTGADRYKEFFDHRERGKSMAGRRYLRLRQGEREKVLKFTIDFRAEGVLADLEGRAFPALAEGASDAEKACHEFRKGALRDAVTHILPGAIELEIRTEWKERADLETLHFLRRNARTLCLRAPYGRHVVLGVDPVVRKGIRGAVLRADGSFVVDATFAHEGEERAASIERARALLREHAVRAIALSDEGSSEVALRFFEEAIAGIAPIAPAEVATEPPAEGAEAAPAAPAPVVVRVPEIGAASIANSPASREEFGDQPVPVRAAISMGRRLQDPLGEFARLEPRTLGGYHHGMDVAKGRLERALAEEVETCVHEVPIDLAVASAPLLAWVGAMGAENAKKIVDWRKEHGAFPSRVALARVGLEEAVYQRAVAFLRVPTSEDPLDATGVHPEHAGVVEALVKAAGAASLKECAPEALAALDLAPLASEAMPPVLLEHVRELLREGNRDPRGEFVRTVYNAGVRSIGHLKQGQELRGIVRGLAPFGVFVDIGIGQDALLHVSEIASHFVEDPSELLKVGEVVTVRVVAVDPPKKKISLTMRTEEERRQAEEQRAADRAARKAAREAARERAEARRRRQEQAVAGAPSGGGDRAPRAAPAVRAATTRRDGVIGMKKRRGPGDRRRDGRGRPGGEDEAFAPESGDAPEKRREAPPPPANPFKRFFESRGLAGN